MSGGGAKMACGERATCEVEAEEEVREVLVELEEHVHPKQHAAASMRRVVRTRAAEPLIRVCTRTTSSMSRNIMCWRADRDACIPRSVQLSWEQQPQRGDRDAEVLGVSSRSWLLRSMSDRVCPASGLCLHCL